MRKKLNNKKIKLKINSSKNDLFKQLTDQELREIRGGGAVEIYSDAVRFFSGYNHKE